MFVIGSLIAVFTGVGALIACETPEILKPLKKLLAISVTLAAIGGAGYTFIPTTKEMFAIKALGSTLEYIQGNEKAKALPDKAIEKIYEYLEEDDNE